MLCFGVSHSNLSIACVTLRSSHIVLGCHQVSTLLSKSGPKTYLDKCAKGDFLDLDSSVLNITTDSLGIRTEL